MFTGFKQKGMHFSKTIGDYRIYIWVINHVGALPILEGALPILDNGTLFEIIIYHNREWQYNNDIASFPELAKLGIVYKKTYYYGIFLSRDDVRDILDILNGTIAIGNF